MKNSATSGANSPEGILSQSYWIGAATSAPQLLWLASAPLLIIRLGTPSFGLLTIFSTMLSVGAGLDGGLGATLVRFLARAQTGEQQTVLIRTSLILAAAISVLIGSLLACLTYGITAQLSTSLSSSGAKLAVLLIPGLMGQTIGGVSTAIMQINGRYTANALISVGGATAQGIAMFVLLPHRGAVAAGGCLIMRLLLTGCLSTGMALRCRTTTPYYLLRSSLFTDFLRFAWQSQLASIYSLVNLESDTLIVSQFLSLKDVAIFGLATTVTGAFRATPGFLAVPISQSLAKSAKTGALRVLNAVETFQSWYLRLLDSYCVTVALAFPPFIRSVVPVQLAGPVIAVTGILLLGYLFNARAAVISGGLIAIGRPDVEARYGLISVVVNAAVTIPGALVFGVLGVAVGTAIGAVVATVWLGEFGSRRLGEVVAPPWNRSFLGMILLCLFLTGTSTVVSDEINDRLLCLASAAGMVIAWLSAGWRTRRHFSYSPPKLVVAE